MTNKILILIGLLFSIHAFGDQYALTVITNYQGNESRSISHVSLYTNKSLCSNKLNDIHLLLSKGGSMGVIYKSGIISAKYKNIEKTFECLKVSDEFITNY